MTKLWIKIYKNDKMIINYMFVDNSKFDINNLFYYLTAVGEILEIPVPLILNKHISHMQNFNHIKFIKEEFVESVSFDKMIVENYSC